MERDDLLWLAGLLEGEGSFLKGPPSAPGNIAIAVHMTDRDVVERVGRLWGRSVAGRPAQKAHHRKTWYSAIRGNPAATLMRELRPLMGQRRQAQIDEALACPIPEPRRVGVHGTARYKEGCRCEVCKVAKHAEYERRKARRATA